MNKIFEFKTECNDGENPPVILDFVVDNQNSEAAAKKWLIDKQAEMGVKAKILESKEVPAPKPDTRIEEAAGGYYFPGWGIHVSATQYETKKRRFRKDKVVGREIDENEAKQLLMENHGIDLDKHPAPPAENVKAGRDSDADTNKKQKIRLV